MTAEEKNLLTELTAKANQEKEQKEKAYNSLVDNLVESLIAKREELQKIIEAHKAWEQSEMNAFLELVKDEYNTKKQRNYTLIHSEGKGKIELQSADLGVYDSRAELASQKIESFLREKFLGEGHTENDRASFDVINVLLGKDKNNNFKPIQIQNLIKMENKFDSADWKEGIELFKQSFNVVSTKAYIRAYKAKESGGYEYISLDYTSL